MLRNSDADFNEAWRDFSQYRTYDSHHWATLSIQIITNKNRLIDCLNGKV